MRLTLCWFFHIQFLVPQFVKIFHFLQLLIAEDIPSHLFVTFSIIDFSQLLHAFRERQSSHQHFYCRQFSTKWKLMKIHADTFWYVFPCKEYMPSSWCVRSKWWSLYKMKATSFLHSSSFWSLRIASNISRTFFCISSLVFSIVSRCLLASFTSKLCLRN